MPKKFNRRLFLKGAAAATVLVSTKSVGAFLDDEEQHIHNYDREAPSKVLKTLEGIEPKVGFIKAQDGVNLRYAVFSPEQKPTGTILLKPGKSGCIEDFQALANTYVQNGYQVICADPRGMGLSGRTLENKQKIHVNDFKEYVSDDALVLDKIVNPMHKDGPLLLVAHSLSGHNAVRGVAEEAYKVDGIVAMAPMIEATALPKDGAMGAAYKVLTTTIKSLWRDTRYQITCGDRNFAELGTPQNNDYTKNVKGFTDFVKRWKKEPRLVTGDPTVAWINAYYKSVKLLQSIKQKSIETPALFCLGKDDTMISNKSAKDMAGRFQSASVLEIDEKHDMEMGSKQTLGQIVSATNKFTKTLTPKQRHQVTHTRLIKTPSNVLGL